MAWTAPRTWVVNEVVTASIMNTHVRDNLNALRELGRTNFTSDVTISATSEGTATTIVTAPAISFDGATETVVDFFCPELSVAANTSGNICVLVLYVDGASIGFFGVLANVSGTIALSAPIKLQRILTPASGSRTYSVRGYRTNANCTAEAGAGGSGVHVPGFIRVRA